MIRICVMSVVCLASGCVIVHREEPRGFEWPIQPVYERRTIWEAATWERLPGEDEQQHQARINWIHRVRELQACYGGLAFYQPERDGGELR